MPCDKLIQAALLNLLLKRRKFCLSRVRLIQACKFCLPRVLFMQLRKFRLHSRIILS